MQSHNAVYVLFEHSKSQCYRPVVPKVGVKNPAVDHETPSGGAWEDQSAFKNQFQYQILP